jgi:hypothetical protein
MWSASYNLDDSDGDSRGNTDCGYQSFFYSSTDAQVICLKNSFKIYIKINIKTAPTVNNCNFSKHE